MRFRKFASLSHKDNSLPMKASNYFLFTTFFLGQTTYICLQSSLGQMEVTFLVTLCIAHVPSLDFLKTQPDVASRTC